MWGRGIGIFWLGVERPYLMERERRRKRRREREGEEDRERKHLELGTIPRNFSRVPTFPLALFQH